MAPPPRENKGGAQRPQRVRGTVWTFMPGRSHRQGRAGHGTARHGRAGRTARSQLRGPGWRKVPACRARTWLVHHRPQSDALPPLPGNWSTPRLQCSRPWAVASAGTSE